MDIFCISYIEKFVFFFKNLHISKIFITFAQILNHT